MSTQVWAISAPDPRRRAFSLLMAMLLVASFFASTIAASAMTPVSTQSDSTLADVVPAESVLYTEMDLDQTSDQWILVYELLSRAGLSDLAEEQAGISPEQVGDLAESLELTGRAALVFTSADAFSTDALDDFGDQATGMTADPTALSGTDVPEGFVVVFQPDDPESLHMQFQSMVSDEASTAGATVETVDYNGTTIEYWTSLDDTTDPTATALVGDTVVLAVRPDDIESVVDTVNGDVDALSSNAQFTSIREAFTTPSINFGFMNGETIAAQMLAEDPELADISGSLSTYAGWNAYASKDGFHLDTVTLQGSDASSDPISTFDPTLVGKFPADSLMVFNGSDLAGTGVFDIFGFALQASLAGSDVDAAYGATPVATPSVDDVHAELEAQLGFNLKTDLFDQLDGEFGAAVNVDQVFSDEPVTDVVFIAKAADETAVSDSLQKITYILNSTMEDDMTLTEREVTGGTVTSITMDAETTGGFPITLEYGVVDGEMLIGVNNGIDSYLAGAAAPLADDATFQQTMSALPQDNVVGLQYLSLERLLPIIEDAATSLSSSMMTLDNDEACGDYVTQEEAQGAYDTDPTGLWNLDLNYDGQACEDFFDMGATAEASPENYTESLKLLSIGTVTYTDGDMYRTSTILLIGE